MSAPAPTPSLYARPAKDYRARPRTSAIVVHCAETAPGRDDIVDAADIRRWHQEPPREWLDIAYHYVIRRDGSLELGRPVWAVGAGVAGANSETVHVCLVGGADATAQRDAFYTNAQWRTLRALAATLTQLYPGAVIRGHRSYAGVGKLCPGFDAGAWAARVGLQPSTAVLQEMRA